MGLNDRCKHSGMPAQDIAHKLMRVEACLTLLMETAGNCAAKCYGGHPWTKSQIAQSLRCDMDLIKKRLGQ